MWELFEWIGRSAKLESIFSMAQSFALWVFATLRGIMPQVWEDHMTEVTTFIGGPEWAAFGGLVAWCINFFVFWEVFSPTVGMLFYLWVSAYVIRIVIWCIRWFWGSA